MKKVNAFIEKYDKVQKYWHKMSSGKDGRIDLKESGLDFKNLDPKHPFVKELSGIKERKIFQKITDEDHMTHFAVRAYLWNKYPDFAKKWDSGAGWFGKGGDGTIQAKEFEEGGFQEQFVKDIKTMIRKQRDRELLVSRPLFSKPGLSIFKMGKAVDTIIQNEIRKSVKKMRSG
ncbi:MAG: hypothetical protein QNK18_00205 [Gammaproteobacteria bacterium]|nr:hypothetical protein [Gammaproteobacteria bacterium]